MWRPQPILSNQSPHESPLHCPQNAIQNSVSDFQLQRPLTQETWRKGWVDQSSKTSSPTPPECIADVSYQIHLGLQTTAPLTKAWCSRCEPRRWPGHARHHTTWKYSQGPVLKLRPEIQRMRAPSAERPNVIEMRCLLYLCIPSNSFPIFHISLFQWGPWQDTF